MKATKTLVTIIAGFILFAISLLLVAFNHYISTIDIDVCMNKYKDYEYCKEIVKE